MPPIDIVRSEEVKEKSDLLGATFWVRILLLVQIGAIVFLHLGIPCNSFSMARSRPGGPPLSDQWMTDEPLGFKNFAQELFATMFIGNELLFRSLILAELVLLAGGIFSLENLESSLM